jgi:sugar lactone lactonase YvrE
MTGTDKIVVKFTRDALEAAIHQGLFDGFRYDQQNRVWIRCDGEDQ